MTFTFFKFLLNKTSLKSEPFFINLLIAFVKVLQNLASHKGMMRRQTVNATLETLSLHVMIATP